MSQTQAALETFISPKHLEGLDLAKACANLALDKKAENLSILEISQLTSFADFFVICSAGSERQAQAIARHIETEMREQGIMPLGIEGSVEGHWILIDLGATIVHVFTKETRDYYDLDGLWVDAPVHEL